MFKVRVYEHASFSLTHSDSVHSRVVVTTILCDLGFASREAVQMRCSGGGIINQRVDDSVQQSPRSLQLHSLDSVWLSTVGLRS